MKAQELRVGNILLYGNKRVIVSGIELDVNSFNYVISCSDRTAYNLYQLKPIPLTEQWLIKLGFEKHFNGYFCERDYLLLKQHKLENKWFAWINKVGDIDCTRINSVHQLQNLYFALTGQELELKETK